MPGKGHLLEGIRLILYKFHIGLNLNTISTYNTDSHFIRHMNQYELFNFQE